MDENEKKAQLDKAIEWAKNSLSPVNPVTYSRDYGYWSGLSDAKKIMGDGLPVTEKPGADVKDPDSA